MIKQSKGITLIALVIAIIILLILAGLSINALTGSGLFQKAQDATRISEIKEIEEVARLSYMERQLEEITGGKNATMAGVISDLKEKGYKIKQITEGANTITGISLSEENVTVERNTEKTVTYTLIYSEETTVRYFVEVQGKDYEILFNNGNITVNTGETNVGEINKEPEVTVTSSDSTIIEANKTEDGKIKLTAKDKIGDTTITIKEINSNVTKNFTVTTRIPATSLTISQTSATIKVEGILNLTATVEPSNTTDEITWTPSDTDVVSITTDTTKKVAIITALKGGTITITVTCGSLSKTCAVTAERFSGLNTGDSNPEGALPNTSITVIESDASKGIVIKDKNDIEWVWIQVPKKTVFTTAKSSTDYDNIKNDLITYAEVYRNSSNSWPAAEWEDIWYSGCGVANSTTYNQMYKKMLKSVYENGGFWIQRCEDGRNWVNCSTAQNYASQMKPDESKTSSLLFGIQWDLVCKYLEVKGGLSVAQINSDSSSWGNQSGTPNAKQERNKKMNIYDFAGNLEEFTLERVMSTNNLINSSLRGYGGTAKNHTKAAAYRRNYNSTGSESISFRATFY